jgi:hypothetical protein
MQNIMQVNEHGKPWHRFPLVWMMFAIPFSAVIMGVIMIWLAIDTDDGLVADDYYKRGLEINRVIKRDKKAAELGLSAVVEFDSSTRVIKIAFEKGLLETFPEILPLRLKHATRENSDINILLNHGINDQYIGHLKQAITEGVWYFEISGASADGDWKLNRRVHVGTTNVIHLQSEYY